jgi:hypothetical protein
VGEFADFIVNAYSQGDEKSVADAFWVIEQLLCDGNEEVRTVAEIGLLEDIMNISSHRPHGAGVFVQWLGPQSRVAWDEVIEMWKGKRSLMDVVRHEQSVRTKTKS